MKPLWPSRFDSYLFTRTCGDKVLPLPFVSEVQYQYMRLVAHVLVQNQRPRQPTIREQAVVDVTSCQCLESCVGVRTRRGHRDRMLSQCLLKSWHCRSQLWGETMRPLPGLFPHTQRLLPFLTKPQNFNAQMTSSQQLPRH